MKRVTTPKLVSITVLTTSFVVPIVLPIVLTNANNNTGYDIETNHILSINDLHGAAEGYGDTEFPNTSYKNPGLIRMASHIDDRLHNNPGTILISGGDNNSGDAFSTATHGETLYPILRSLECQYSAVGNHGFEWGLDDLASYKFDRLARTDQTQGRYFVCGNILNHSTYRTHEWTIDENDPSFVYDYNIWKSQRVSWADSYKLIDLHGHLVCLLGLSTTGMLTDGNQKIISNLTIMPYVPALYYISKYCFDTIGANLYDKIDSFVLLTHVESEDSTDPDKSVALNLAKTLHIYEPDKNKYTYTQKVSSIISAHSHKKVDDSWIKNDYTNQDIFVGQAETAGRAYLDLSLTFDNSKQEGLRWVPPQTQKEKEDVFRVVDVDNIDYGGFDPTNPDEEERAFSAASFQYESFLNNPSTPYTKKVVAEFKKQESIVCRKLNEPIAYSDISITYSPLHEPEKVLGHDYITPNHICDQIGAWANMAQIVGFSSLYKEQIESPDSSLDYPSVSFFDVDSLTTEFEPGDIRLLDMYQIQTYENPLYFGYLSIWQIANIIDYLLSGKNSFVYGSDTNRNYLTENQSGRVSYSNGEHDITFNYQHGNGQGIRCAKDGTINKALYLCGNYQWYGLQITLEETDEVASKLDAEYRLNYVKSTNDGKYYPNMKIFKPGTNPKENIVNVDSWVSAEDWSNQYNGIVPCVFNSFLFDNGNGQAAMFKPYVEYTQSLDETKYKIHGFSEFSRDAMIEFCKLTRGSLYSFEMTKSLSESLVIGYKE